MDVLLTPDVIEFLSIDSCSVAFPNEKKYFSLLAFSEITLAFLTFETPPDCDGKVSLEMKTKTDTSLFDLEFETKVRTATKHWILRFFYEAKYFEPSLNKRFDSLLTISSYQQMRKDVRLSLSKQLLNSLHLVSMEVSVWFLSQQKKCLLRDISFSGARFFTTDDVVIDCDDKIVMKLSFSNPSEIATLRAVVVRKQSIKINSIDCLDVAVRFLDPVDFVFLSRLTRYFELASREAN